MNANILPIQKPMIRGHLYNAFPLSVASFHPSFYNWIYTNFTNLKVFEHDFSLDIVFDTGNIIDHPETYPLLNVEKIKNTDLVLSDLLQTFKHYIDTGKYIYLFMDEFYINNRSSYQKRHFIHETFIYGYDDLKEEFEVCGFNDKMIYCTHLVPYASIYEGLVNNQYTDGWAGFTYILELDIGQIFDLNLDKIYHSFEHNVNLSQDQYSTFGLEHNVAAYGNSIYSFLEDVYLHKKHKMEHSSVVRNMYVIQEYHLLKQSCIEFLQNHGYIHHLPEELLTSYACNVKNSKTALNIILKNYITNKPDNTKIILGLLKSISEKESYCSNYILQQLHG
ncbi:hypothetical protein MKX42_11165 [Paenibacillus sp. FSL R7-0204]|uniref:hypothetical protein n=1 Tax=Paenibacillus sp. FSL R7-0204 TaxID=2921675 RepID=UPI0030F5C5CD